MPNDFSYIERAYHDYLFRSVDAAGLASYSARRLDADALGASLMESAEYKEKAAPTFRLLDSTARPRVVLFGAYGNGNLGDDMQAQALSRLVKAIAPHASIFSTSLFGGTYTVPEFVHALPRGAVYSRLVQDRLDLMMIGGGGLLAHPHAPLDNPKWAADLKVPVAIVGVGADHPNAQLARGLLRRAAYVSGRDASSSEALSSFCLHVRHFHDPVLVSPEFDKSSTDPRHSVCRTCWVVRGPPTEDLLALRDVIEDEDVIVGLEPRADADLSHLFPRLRLISRVEDFLMLAQRSERIVSMRYHGVILGLLAGTPSFGYRVKKGESLLDMFGLQRFVIGNIANADLSQDFPLASVMKRIRDCRQGANIEMAHILGKLLDN